MAETNETAEPTVGEQLRSAREAQGLSLDEIAARTRIPTRHLEAIEQGEWQRLPAPTYSIGFAKSYATAVGLDRGEVGEKLRAEMGGARANQYAAEVYDTADPKRVPPFTLLIGAAVAIVLAFGLMLWLRDRSLEGPAGTAGNAIQANASGPAAAPVAPGGFAPAASGPVVITANEPVWIKVTDGGKQLRQAELAAGQSYEVPASATAPLLETGRPEALRISVGTADAPPIGPAGRKVSGVSLRPADLLRPSPAASPGAPAAPGAAPATPR